MFRKITSLFLVCCLFVIPITGCGGSDDDFADIVITNASVYTVDKDGTMAEAVAVKNGEIVYVGDAEGLSEFKGDKTQVIDLEGGTLMPSLIDSHLHPAMSAAMYLYEISLHNVFGLEEYTSLISEFIEDNPDLDAYVGAGFMRSVFDTVGPRKETLDQLESEKPVIITSIDGHSMWVNSKALELAGITKTTKDPEGGVIQRDPKTGEPAGLLQESAMQLVDDLMPQYTKEQYKVAILWLQEWFNSLGFTTIFDALVELDNPAYYQAYQELAEDGDLTLRVRGGWHMYPEMGQENYLANIEKGIELSKEFTTPYFQINAFKFLSDQVVEEQTAYMAEPYLGGEEGWRGIKVWDNDVMEDLFTRIDKEGFQLHIHQIGDAAATYTLDVLEKVVEKNGVRDSRHSFAHVQFLNDNDIQRMADLKMNAIIAPYWMAMDDYYWDIYMPVLGEERVNNMYPAQSLFDAGINTAIHSDFFVTEPDPGWLIYGALTRTVPEKIADMWYEGMGLTRTTDINYPMEEMLIGPLPPHNERMTLDEVLRAATYNGAYANFMEGEVGSIEVGKKADIILFSENLFDLDVEDLANVLPIMTIFDGKVIFDQREAPQE
jgi:predicted amidohydrolase YtcJ